MSGTIYVNGVVVEQATVAQVEAVQAPNTHVGTPTQNFSVNYNNCLVSFSFNQPFIADAGLYALLGAGSALVTWSD